MVSTRGCLLPLLDYTMRLRQSYDELSIMKSCVPSARRLIVGLMICIMWHFANVIGSRPRHRSLAHSTAVQCRLAQHAD